MLNLTLTYPHDAFEKILKFLVCGWDSKLENSNDGQQANYLHYWVLYDINVVLHTIYLILM